MKQHYIIDFDSTFTRVEALDELAKISLKDHPEKEEIFLEIENLTNLAMEGKLSFRESLSKRIQLLHANRKHLDQLVENLRMKVSKSFERNKDFFKTHRDYVYIMSGGFKEFITPVVKPFHIKKKNIFANTFTFDKEGNIIGYDQDNPLSEEGGKVKLMNELNFQGEVFGIGDGYSDFQLKESGVIEKFFAFTENISRPSVTEKADHITPSFDEFLYVNSLPRATSYPKNRILCLIVGDVPEIAIAILKEDGFSIRVKSTFEEKYTEDVGMLLVGPDTTLDDLQLERADKLKTIGYLGNSKGKVNHDICNKKGIVLFDDKKGKKKQSEFIPRRMANFINNGDTHKSRNFPNLKLPKLTNAHRLLHIHQNIPGIMAKLNNVYADNEINIISQFLMTKDEIGYAVTDIKTAYDKKLLKQLKEIAPTIKFRTIYK